MGASFWMGLLALTFAVTSWLAARRDWQQMSEWLAIAAFGAIIAFMFSLTT